MKILYGVVGEGMGHATRSRVVIEHLLSCGHEVLIVVSGRAHGFLVGAFADRAGVEIREIKGFSLVYQGAGIDKSASLLTNVEEVPDKLQHNLEAYVAILGNFQPRMVISDFESWSYLYARAHDIPVVSIDNMQVINRCSHAGAVSSAKCFNFRVSRLAVKTKLPDAYHYLVTSFFFPHVRKKRTTLVPPILRPEILAARREPGQHVLVYQTADANTELLPLLAKLPFEFRIYGMGEGEQGNLIRRPFSQAGFIDDLRTARAVIAGGGYSLMGEAVHLRVPMLSVPLVGQYEQELNARYLSRLGYGAWAHKLDEGAVVGFLDELDQYQLGLQRYEPRDNKMLTDCVDELVRSIALGEPRPAALQAENMGDSTLSSEA